MLEIRPSCEHCDKDLPFDSKEAYICTFECTYCKNCVEDILSHVCPNCGGNFQQRPIRPKELHEKYPLSRKRIHKPADLEKHKERIEVLIKTTH
jgi:hypothetical protein